MGSDLIRMIMRVSSSPTRYSVLLPTRNGGKFLRNCIESILSQEYDDFELVISDNANTDETPAIVEKYRTHPRVVTLRLDAPVPVTDNWNAALRASSGDYILMMGDDDFLLPDYFRRMDAILERHGDPDCVLYNGYSFVAPDSIGGDTKSFYSPRHFDFGPDLQSERQLSTDEQLGIVRDMFRWRIRIPLNMQTALVARSVGERIKGGFFQPPFPDHYALNALMLTGARWIFSPERLVVVGVSPKSFGHYVYSSREASGLAYLGIDPKSPGQLPGSPLLNGMHEWLYRLLASYPPELAGINVDRGGYVRRQIYNWLMQVKFGGLHWFEAIGRLRDLSAGDWMDVLSTPFDAESWRRLAGLVSRRSGAAQTQITKLRRIDGCRDIAEFARWVAQRQV
jgi:glycosyltransferase involved in cell wall biosynthesis